MTGIEHGILAYVQTVLPAIVGAFVVVGAAIFGMLALRSRS